MENALVKKFKWFWAWQDEAEEAWLGEMSKKGYHLSSVGVAGIYTFFIDEPRDYVYRLDYRMFPKKDKQEYLQLFRDAGWEYIGEMSTWQYFRKHAKQGEANEIFTDAESKIAKYTRILTFLGFFWIVLVAVLVGRISRISVENPYPWWGVIDGIQLFTFLVFLLFTYIIIRLATRIRQLKRL